MNVEICQRQADRLGHIAQQPRDWTEYRQPLTLLLSLQAIGASMKIDPLIPVRQYFSRYVMHGMGLFVEGFVLFSIGNLTPLFKVRSHRPTARYSDHAHFTDFVMQAVWPECWSTHEVGSRVSKIGTASSATNTSAPVLRSVRFAIRVRQASFYSNS